MIESLDPWKVDTVEFWEIAWRQVPQALGIMVRKGHAGLSVSTIVVGWGPWSWGST